MALGAPSSPPWTCWRRRTAAWRAAGTAVSPLSPYEADFHWPEHRLIVETDGREHHARRRDFARDRARDAENLVRGWRTVRFTYGQVAYEARWVAGVVAALTRAGRA